jgi:hypothetical protein
LTFSGVCGFCRGDDNYIITFRTSDFFAGVAFGDGGFIAAVVAVKPDKRFRLIHFAVRLSRTLKSEQVIKYSPVFLLSVPRL